MDTTLTQKTIELYLLLLKSDKVNAKSFSAEYQDWSIWHVFLVHNIRVHFLICGILSPELAPFLSSRILMLWAIKIKVGFFWNFLVENLNKFLDLSPNPVLPKAVSSILFFQIGLFQEQSDVLFLLKPLRQNLKDHLQQSLEDSDIGKLVSSRIWHASTSPWMLVSKRKWSSCLSSSIRPLNEGISRSCGVAERNSLAIPSYVAHPLALEHLWSLHFSLSLDLPAPLRGIAKDNPLGAHL